MQSSTATRAAWRPRGVLLRWCGVAAGVDEGVDEGVAERKEGALIGGGSPSTEQAGSALQSLSCVGAYSDPSTQRTEEGRVRRRRQARVGAGGACP